MACHGSILMYGFTAFINPIASTSGWSLAQISFATSLRGLESGALNPFFGAAVDRWPAKRLVLIGMAVYGLGLFLVSKATSLITFYAAFLISALGSSLAVQMVPPTMIARWFRKNVGLASGVLTMGVGIGGLLIPLLVKLIDTYGWQNALVILAAGVWVLGIPLSFVFRNRPEDYGLLPDGKLQGDSKGSDSLRDYDFSTGVREALKMRAFWHIGIATIFQTAGASAGTVHMMPYLASLGVERSTAGMVAMLVPLASLVVRIPTGLLADIINKKYVLALSVGLVSVALFLFWLIDGSSFLLMLLFAVTFGFGLGGFMPARLPLFREYFGTKNFGVIFGLTSIFQTLGLVTGPPIAGWVFDTLGYFDPIWLILSGTGMVGVMVALTMPPPSRKPKPIVS